MSVIEEAAEVIASWHLDETPGPWYPAPTPEDGEGEPELNLWLTNAAGDSLMVDDEDAAVMVNALPLLVDRLAVSRPGEDEPFCAECGHLTVIHREGSCYTNVGGPSPEPCGCQNDRAVRLGALGVRA